MINIFLVSGKSGQWDDESRWNVCWFEDLTQARDFRDALQQRADQIHLKKMANEAPTEIHELDPEFVYWDSAFLGERANYSITQIEKGDLGKLLK